MLTHTKFTYAIRTALTTKSKLEDGLTFSEIDAEVLNEDGVEIDSQKFWNTDLCQAIILSIGSMTHTKYTYLTRQAIEWFNGTEVEELVEMGVANPNPEKYAEIIAVMSF